MEEIRFAANRLSRELSVTGGCLSVINKAVEPGHNATFDRTFGGALCSYAVSISTGTVKGSAGVLYGFWGSTGGTMAVKDGSSQLGVLTISANVFTAMPFPISCATSITISASAAVATVLYI